MWTRVNPACMFLNISEGNYLKTVKDTQNMRQRYRKTLDERISNHIQHVQFDRKTSVSQSNLLYPYMEYMCINTQNDRKCQNASKCLLWNGTESNDTSSYILLDHCNAFGLSGGNFLTRTSLPEPILSGEGGGVNFQLSTIPPFGAPSHFDWTKLAHAQLGYGAYNIRP